MSTTLLAKAHENGLGESLRLGRDIAWTRVARLSRRDAPSSIFLSPPIGNSGAPQILLQVVDEFAERYGSKSVRVLSPRVLPEMRSRLSASEVRVERAVAAMGPTLVGLQLALRKNDFVLMNTVGVLRNYQTFLFASLRAERLAHAYWYIHEDIDQLSVVAPFLLQSDVRSLIGQLVEQDRLTLLVPSHKVKTQYDEFFGTEKTRLLPFKSDLDNRYSISRPAERLRVDEISSVWETD